MNLQNNGKPWSEMELYLVGSSPRTENDVRRLSAFLKRSPKAVKHMWAKLYWSNKKLRDYAIKYPHMSEHYLKILKIRKELGITICTTK